MDGKELRDRVSKIVLAACVQLQSADDDWVDFVVDELVENLSSITTPVSVQNLIGDHLESISLTKSQELSSLGACRTIFSQLRQQKVIAGSDPEPKPEDDEPQETEPEEGSEDSEGAGSYKETGGCVICHREMPLTKHHLIPREVHEWYKRREGKTHKELHTGIMVCRSCHSAIHKFISNKDMGAEYNTLEKILSHEKVQGWIPYISKQRCVSKADQRTWVQHGPRDMPRDADSD